MKVAPKIDSIGAEIFGRCQHPIQNGSGIGVFEGVIGRLNFKDTVEAGELIKNEDTA